MSSHQSHRLAVYKRKALESPPTFFRQYLPSGQHLAPFVHYWEPTPPPLTSIHLHPSPLPTVGIVALMVWMMHRARDDFDNPNVSDLLEPLIREYDTGFHYWVVLVQVRKLIAVLINVFFSQAAVSAQTGLRQVRLRTTRPRFFLSSCRDVLLS